MHAHAHAHAHAHMRMHNMHVCTGEEANEHTTTHALQTPSLSLERLYSRSPESYQETTGAASTAVTTIAISLRRRHGTV
jgi:hypothetical protein